jgi:hypothetical protein
MHPSLRRWLTETASYATVTSVSSAGDPVYGAPISFVCRSEFEVQFHGPMFVPRQGEEQELFTRLFSEIEIPLDARVWFPGTNTSDAAQSNKVKRRAVIRTDTGAVSHYETYF